MNLAIRNMTSELCHPPTVLGHQKAPRCLKVTDVLFNFFWLSKNSYYPELTRRLPSKYHTKTRIHLLIYAILIVSLYTNVLPPFVEMSVYSFSFGDFIQVLALYIISIQHLTGSKGSTTFCNFCMAICVWIIKKSISLGSRSRHDQLSLTASTRVLPQGVIIREGKGCLLLIVHGLLTWFYIRTNSDYIHQTQNR